MAILFSGHGYAGFTIYCPKGFRRTDCVASRLSNKRSAVVGERIAVSGLALGFSETGEQVAFGALHCLSGRQIGLRLGLRL